MKPVKKIVPLDLLVAQVQLLMEDYRNIRVFLPGSERHVKAGLGEKEALIHAWGRKRR